MDISKLLITAYKLLDAAQVLDETGNREDSVVALAKLRKLPNNEPELEADVVARGCRMCGCTDCQACEGGCYWVEHDLCSRCAKTETQNSKKGARKNDHKGTYILPCLFG